MTPLWHGHFDVVVAIMKHRQRVLIKDGRDWFVLHERSYGLCSEKVSVATTTAISADVDTCRVCGLFIVLHFFRGRRVTGIVY